MPCKAKGTLVPNLYRSCLSVVLVDQDQLDFIMWLKWWYFLSKQMRLNSVESCYFFGNHLSSLLILALTEVVAVEDVFSFEAYVFPLGHLLLNWDLYLTCSGKVFRFSLILPISSQDLILIYFTQTSLNWKNNSQKTNKFCFDYHFGLFCHRYSLYFA